MPDQQDLWTLWTNLESDLCAEHGITHTGDCMSHYGGRDDYESMLTEMQQYLTRSGQWMDMPGDTASAVLDVANGVVCLATAVAVLFYALTECRKLIEGLGAPEPEPGETLYHLLDDLKGTP
ncbi:unnamed protein product [marine sediment metagenome]|uniref:Uncharacterized protein n=1 Tax=marine sediment metagenome TaxID=412755 RepID=X1SBC8_9ZZZZ